MNSQSPDSDPLDALFIFSTFFVDVLIVAFFFLNR